MRHRLRLEHRRVVRLVDLVRREVRRVDRRRQPRLERRPDPPQTVELHAPEERVVLDLVRSAPTEPHLCVTDKAV